MSDIISIPRPRVVMRPGANEYKGYSPKLIHDTSDTTFEPQQHETVKPWQPSISSSSEHSSKGDVESILNIGTAQSSQRPGFNSESEESNYETRGESLRRLLLRREFWIVAGVLTLLVVAALGLGLYFGLKNSGKEGIIFFTN